MTTGLRPSWPYIENVSCQQNKTARVEECRILVTGAPLYDRLREIFFDAFNGRILSQAIFQDWEY